MRKSNLMKKFLILMLTLMCIIFTCNFVYAAEEDDFQDLLTGTDNNNTNKNNNTNINTNTNTNINTNNTLNTNPITSTNNTTNLPKTGISDTIPTMLLVVIFGVSAVYAYKKVKDYQTL